VTVDLGAGCGLRQGEILTLGVDGIERTRPVIHVVRQVKIMGNRLVFALPKGRKTRDVPLPQVVADRLDVHIRRHPPTGVHHLAVGDPIRSPDHSRSDHRRQEGVPMDRNNFNRGSWWPAALAAGFPKERQNGMHALRHYYASVLLVRESIKALATYLGHADPGFTLWTYTHLRPSSEDRTRRAIDRAFVDDSDSPDGPTA
jgi:integrase